MRKRNKKEKQMKNEQEIKEIFRTKNDEGLGFPVGEPGMTPREAAEFDGYTVEYETCDGVCYCGGIIVADVNGPWAVYVE
jgi:hypothetical protein